MQKSPNILMLVNDHQAYYRHGWDGGVRPQRPNFDKLAAKGLVFERCYAVAPLCVPVRTTLATGLYPHNHLNVRNNTNAPYNHELIFDAMARAGYRNYYYGKWHAGAGLPEDYGADGFSREGYGNPYISKAYKRYLEKLGLEMPKRKIEKVFYTDDFLVQHPDLVPGAQDYISNKTFSGENAVGISLGPKETHESFFLADQARQALRSWKETSQQSPFFMRVDFWGPHHPHFPSQEFVDLYKTEDIGQYGSLVDDLEGRPSIYRESYAPLLNKDGKLAIPGNLSQADWQLICARAYAHISQVDAAGGQIIDTLRDLGLSEDTIVIWTTDHGDALASHGGQWDKGSYMTEEVMRVPFAISQPGTIVEGKICKALINSVDIPASIVDFAGASFSQPIDGKSIQPLCCDPGAPWRKELLCETYGIGFGRQHFAKALITNTQKFVWNVGDIDELYDLEADPYELHNLVAKSDSASVVSSDRRWILDSLSRVPKEQAILAEDAKARNKSLR